MANRHRKLASIQEVREIRSIEGADRIEVAVIEAWQVVVGKGEFAVGDEVVYFEIDSFLPASNPAFASLMERGTKEMELSGHIAKGHVLRTAKLRGTYSQGLAMRQEQLGLDPATHSVGDDVTDEIGICEYVPVMTNPEAIGRYDERLAPVTDAIRIQSCPDAWDVMRKVDCRASVKVDGTSMTIVYDSESGAFRIFGHHYELDPADGLGKQALTTCKRQGIASFCESHPDYVVQFEFAGPKVNKNRLGLSTHRAFVFAVWVDGRTKVPFEDEAACPGKDYDALRKSACPVLDMTPAQLGSVEDAIRWVDGLRGNIVRDRLDEGIVFHVMGRGEIPESEWPTIKAYLMDVLGEPLEMKVINNRYLIKHKI